MFKASLLWKHLNKKLPWYLKSIFTFSTSCLLGHIKQVLSFTAGTAPAGRSAVELFFASNHSESYFCTSTMFKWLFWQLLRQIFFFRRKYSFFFNQRANPYCFKEYYFFHLILWGEIIVKRRCFHLYKILYKLLIYFSGNTGKQQYIWHVKMMKNYLNKSSSLQILMDETDTAMELKHESVFNI